MLNQIVNSSNIKHIGHAHDVLYIKFKSGDVYSYDEVPIEVYQQLVTAESVGQAFHKLIKNVFNHNKVGYDPFPAVLLLEESLYHPLSQGRLPG